MDEKLTPYLPLDWSTGVIDDHASLVPATRKLKVCSVPAVGAVHDRSALVELAKAGAALITDNVGRLRLNVPVPLTAGVGAATVP